MTGDEYMELLLQRQSDWMAEQAGVTLRFPPLLEWFVRPGDEELFTPPDETPQPKPVRKPRTRRPVDVAALEARRDALIVKRDAVAEFGSDDMASTNLSPYSRSKVAATAGRRRFAQMDSALERYAKLNRQVRALEGAYRLGEGAAVRLILSCPYYLKQRTQK